MYHDAAYLTNLVAFDPFQQCIICESYPLARIIIIPTTTKSLRSVYMLDMFLRKIKCYLSKLAFWVKWERELIVVPFTDLSKWRTLRPTLDKAAATTDSAKPLYYKQTNKQTEMNLAF